MKNLIIWNIENMPTVLSDKTYILTGTSSGIGIVIAYELAKRYPKIINVYNSEIYRY